METIDNQSNSNTPELETAAQNQVANSSTKNDENNALDFSKLTHQNWLFINGFLSTRNIKKAYELAKYTGKDESAPYQIFKKLKIYIEAVGDLDVTSRARLQADVKELLEIPLLESAKLGLTIKEKLEVLKLAAKITPEATQQKPNISVLIINRPAKGTVDTAEVNTSQSDPSKNIIDINPTL